ncbi:MAG: ComEC/Rec2 family competence protein [Bryobacteraceae bacterium]
MPLRDPLVVPLGGIAAGIVASRRLAFEPGPVWIALTALALLAVLATWKVSRRAAALAWLAAFLAVGILVDLAHRPGAPPRIEFTPGESLRLEGCVVQPPAIGEDREQFVLELEPGARVRVNWYVREGEEPPRLHYGLRVALDARLRRPHNYNNPGSFDFVHYLARRDIHWLGSANAKSGLEMLGECGDKRLAWIYGLREAAVTRLDEIYAQDAFAAGMTRGILIGDTARLEQNWVESFRRTGTYHALVISGLHLTTLTACFVFLLRVASVGVGWSLALTAAMGWIYALAAGGSAPVVRAAAGLTLFGMGRFLFRRPRVLNLLAAVAIGFLLIDPEQLFDPSFQLSFLSVALIGAIAVPMLERTTDPFARAVHSLGDKRIDSHLPPRAAAMRVEWRLLAETLALAIRVPERWSLLLMSIAGRCWFFVWNLFVVSGVVQCGLALPMVSYFHSMPVTGLTANLLIVPAMNLVIPAGFLALATGWHWPAWAAAALIRFSSQVADWHARRDPGGRVPEPPEWLLWAFVVALILAAVSIPARPAFRWAGGVAFALALGLLLIHPFPAQTEAGKLEVTAIDVGQGDSLWIAAPTGETMLVDTGGFLTYGRRKPSFDIGEEVVSDYLFTRSIKRIDLVAISHAHEDHMGGLRAVAANFRPREVWIGAFPEVEPWISLRGQLRDLGVRVVTPKAGETRRWGATQIEFLSPPSDYEPGAAPKNNDSLAFRIEYGASSFLFTGDVERAMERRMLDDGRLRPVDVLKVAHHGSRTSSTADFLDAVKPHWAIISDGAENQFHHPHPQILERLDERGVKLLRTDERGLITIKTDGRRWTIGCFACP